jgi:outer membrane protein TolC
MICFCVLVVNATAQVRDLNDYLTAGIRNSPALAEFSHQAQSNLLDSARMHAAFLPQLSFNGAAMYAPIVDGFGYDEAITNGGAYSALFSLSQPIVGGGNREHQYRTLNRLRRSLDNNRLAAEMGLRKAITSQYITAFSDRLQVQYLDEAIALFRSEEQALRRLTENGVYRQVDFETFRLSSQQLAMQRREIAAQYQSDVASLNLLCGIRDTAEVELAEPILETDDRNTPDRSPLARQFLLDSLILQSQDEQIDFSYHPRLNLQVDAGFLSSLAFRAEQNFGASVGVNVNVPLFDGGQRDVQHEQVAILECTRSEYRDAFFAQNETQGRLLHRQLHTAEELIIDAEQQAQSAASIVASYRALLSAGDARIVDYLLAVGASIAAQNLVTQYRMNRLQIINQINFLYLAKP